MPPIACFCSPPWPDLAKILVTLNRSSDEQLACNLILRHLFHVKEKPMPSKRLPNAVTQEQQTAFRKMLEALLDRGVGRHEIATRCRASRSSIYRGVLAGPDHKQTLARLGALYELKAGKRPPASVPAPEPEVDLDLVPRPLAHLERFAPGCAPRWGR